MSVFGEYAHCYDLLYRDKDYAGEARFVKGLLDRHALGARRVLDLGCGSGRHAALLAGTGLSVHGVDYSADMLDEARRRAAALPEDIRARLSFSEGDVRTLRLNETFNAVTALFHVVSYQPTDADLAATFATAAAHLRPGGVFLFDCWYGPTVLHEPPEIRIKRAEDESIRVVRLCDPEMLADQNTVIVRYTIFVEDKASGSIRKIEESHRMRYLFTAEVERLLAGVGMTLADSAEWLTGRKPGDDTFAVWFAGRRT
jgi:SAM-dependent methyltransferase